MDSKIIINELKMQIFPVAILREKSVDVSLFDHELCNIIAKMKHIMHSLRGIGIAANQVGLNKRIALVNVISNNTDNNSVDSEFKNYSDELLVIINPIINWRSAEIAKDTEGCLSLPEVYALVKRPIKVIVSYNDQWGNTHTIKASGLLARCLQHEIDHLNGKLFIDYINPVKRRLLINQFFKKR